jgi:hypothetical protein
MGVPEIIVETAKLEVVPFEPWHLGRLVLQDAQAWMRPQLLAPDYGRDLAASGPCYSLWHGFRPVMSCGLIDMWTGRAQAWSLLDVNAKRHMLGVVRAFDDLLERHPVRRVEAIVASGFLPGHRMIRMLGFEIEGLMRRYLPDGRDAAIYSRVRDGSA